MVLPAQSGAKQEYDTWYTTPLAAVPVLVATYWGPGGVGGGAHCLQLVAVVEGHPDEFGRHWMLKEVLLPADTHHPGAHTQEEVGGLICVSAHSSGSPGPEPHAPHSSASHPVEEQVMLTDPPGA